MSVLPIPLACPACRVIVNGTSKVRAQNPAIRKSLKEKTMRPLLLSITVLTLSLLTACATPQMGPGATMITDDVPQPQTYDYTVAAASKDILFQRARDYFATSFGDSRSVIRVQDEGEGLILGKGAVQWSVQPASSPYPVLSCYSEYDVRFLAKNGKARLQVELIRGAPSYSVCSGWQLPTVTGYQKILEGFNTFSKSLGTALEGKGSSEEFRNF